MGKMSNDQKLEELILYIAQASEDDPRFGAVKLNKLLFYSDFLAFAMFGEAITGQEYQKLKHGPAPRKLLTAQYRLKSAGDIVMQPVPTFGGHTQNRCHAQRSANLEMFTEDELSLVNTVIAKFKKNNAKGISTLSHEFVGWKLAEIGETIPYEVALVGERKPTKLERSWGRSLTQRAKRAISSPSKKVGAELQAIAR